MTTCTFSVINKENKTKKKTFKAVRGIDGSDYTPTVFAHQIVFNFFNSKLERSARRFGSLRMNHRYPNLLGSRD